MTVVAGAVVATVATAGLAAPVVTAPALSGMVAGSASAASAAAGTATAGTAAAGTAAGASTAGLTVTGIASGPVGWLLLGAEPHSSTQYHPVSDATFDCWKPVLRDDSTQLSSGKLLKEMMTDERIKEIIIGECRNEFNLPELSLINIWDERFDINYLVLPSNNQLVAHAILAA